MNFHVTFIFTLLGFIGVSQAFLIPNYCGLLFETKSNGTVQNNPQADNGVNTEDLLDNLIQSEIQNLMFSAATTHSISPLRLMELEYYKALSENKNEYQSCVCTPEKSTDSTTQNPNVDSATTPSETVKEVNVSTNNETEQRMETPKIDTCEDYKKSRFGDFAYYKADDQSYLKNWTDAQAICRKCEGADLVIADSDEEVDYLVREMLDRNMSGTWIGFLKNDWPHSDSDGTSYEWKWNGRTENLYSYECFYLDAVDGKQGTVKSRWCKELIDSFVCKKKS